MESWDDGGCGDGCAIGGGGGGGGGARFVVDSNSDLSKLCSAKCGAASASAR